MPFCSNCFAQVVGILQDNGSVVCEFCGNLLDKSEFISEKDVK